MEASEISMILIHLQCLKVFSADTEESMAGSVILALDLMMMMMMTFLGKDLESKTISMDLKWVSMMMISDLEEILVDLAKVQV